MTDKSKYDLVFTIVLKEGGKHGLTEDTVKIEVRQRKGDPLEELDPADVEQYRENRKDRKLGDLDYDMWPSIAKEVKMGLYLFECPNGWVFQDEPFRFANRSLYRVVLSDGSSIAAFEAAGSSDIKHDDKYDICVHKLGRNGGDWDIDPIIRNGSSEPFSQKWRTI